MLATLTERRFSDPDWIFERKLDGERVLAYRRDGRVHLWSRNRRPLEGGYPEVAEAIAAQPGGDLVVDGEIVAFEGNRTSFARLQRRMQVRGEAARATGVAVVYSLFDLLHLDGRDTTGLALRDRKRLLRGALRFGDPIRFTPHRNAQGEARYAEACAKGWEGLIAKRADAPYAPGRSRDWLKFKCEAEQEFVIGGWTDPQGSRTGFGALLLGYHEDGRLRYAGKVGTGYDGEALGRISARLAPLEQPEPPFVDPPRARVRVHWARPELVAQVGFSEWTRDGRLRHPRFRGLRRDKSPAEVVREGGGP